MREFDFTFVDFGAWRFEVSGCGVKGSGILGFELVVVC